MPASAARSFWAHPRSRGENDLSDLCDLYDLGSSPLTRGKPSSPSHAKPVRGLIPAHAGKTSRTRQCRNRGRAHPRSRGENFDEFLELGEREGSSPLTRGKPPIVGAYTITGGLIPAHAGKTRRSRSGTTPDRAHPRSRGENWGASAAPSEPPGSSPLTRGKRARLNRGLAQLGLIPAHAGKTSRRRCRRSPGGAHPRSRGENAIMALTGALMKGSSPLTRGKRRGQAGGLEEDGLIPAHAGKTSGSSRRQGGRRAHPRSRGENTDK